MSVETSAISDADFAIGVQPSSDKIRLTAKNVFIQLSSPNQLMSAMGRSRTLAAEARIMKEGPDAEAPDPS